MSADTKISDRIWQSSQSWNRELIRRVGARKVRLTVHKDAYAFQSWARAHVWKERDMGWELLHEIPGEQLTTKVSYVSHGAKPEDFADDLAELLRVCEEMLT